MGKGPKEGEDWVGFPIFEPRERPGEHLIDMSKLGKELLHEMCVQMTAPGPHRYTFKVSIICTAHEDGRTFEGIFVKLDTVESPSGGG